MKIFQAKENLNPDTIKAILNSQFKHGKFQSLECVQVAGYTYQDLFKGTTGNNDFFAIKIRQKSESIKNALKYLKSFNRRDDKCGKHPLSRNIQG